MPLTFLPQQPAVEPSGLGEDVLADPEARAQLARAIALAQHSDTPVTSYIGEVGDPPTVTPVPMAFTGPGSTAVKQPGGNATLMPWEHYTAAQAAPSSSGGRQAAPIVSDATGRPWEEYAAAQAAPTAPAQAPPAYKGDPGNIFDTAYHGLTGHYGDEFAGMLAGGISKLTGGDYMPAYEKTRDYVRGRVGDYAERHPYIAAATDIGSSILPLAIAGPAATIVKARPFATAAGTGALYGFGSGEGGVENRLEGAGIGGGTGLLGYGALRGVGKAARWSFFPNVTKTSRQPDFQRALDNLRANEIPVTAGEQIASKSGRLAERASQAAWGSTERFMNRESTLYGKLMERANFHPNDVEIGELSQAAVQRAQQRFNQGYDQALTGVRVRLGDMDPHLQRIQQAYGTLLPFEQRSAITNILNDFREQVGTGRVIGGRDYQRLRSTIGNLQDSANRSTTTNYLSPVYRALKNTLDNAFNQAAPRGVANQVQALNRQYGAFKLLQKAEGNPEALGTLANNAWRNGSRVDPEFVRLIRDYQKVVLRGAGPTSGTAENTFALGHIPQTKLGLINALRTPLKALGTKAVAWGERPAIGGYQVLPSFRDPPPGVLPFAVGQQSGLAFPPPPDQRW